MLNSVSERLLKSILYIFLSTLFVMPIVCRTILRYPDNEAYFPYWSTDLFAGLNFDSRLFTIKIFLLDDLKFPEGIDNFELTKTHDGVGMFSPATVISLMGQTLEKNKIEDFEVARKLFEQNYFRKNRHAIYSLNDCQLNFLERWRTGKFKSQKEIGRFEYKR